MCAGENFCNVPRDAVVTTDERISEACCPWEWRLRVTKDNKASHALKCETAPHKRYVQTQQREPETKLNSLQAWDVPPQSLSASSNWFKLHLTTYGYSLNHVVSLLISTTTCHHQSNDDSLTHSLPYRGIRTQEGSEEAAAPQLRCKKDEEKRSGKSPMILKSKVRKSANTGDKTYG